MGIDYSASLAVGYRITTEELRSIFGKEFPPVVRMEKRFSPFDGSPIADEEVIVQEEEFLYVLGDKKFDFAREMLEAICEKIGGATYWIDGSFYSDDELMDYIIGPDLKIDTAGHDEGRVSSSGGIFFAKLLELAPDVIRIGQALGELGFPSGKRAEVTCTLLVS